MVAFSCSHCGMKLKVKEEFAGRSSRCPACKQALTVPVPDVTKAFAPSEPMEGTPSSVDRAGLNDGITLAQGNVPPGQQPVQELLRQTAPGERYVLAGEIARGGMGAVLRAVDRDIRREVAVKFMLDQTDARKKARFVEEAQITGQLEHPNIPPVHELGIDSQERLFFSMKMVKGRSLADVLDDLRKRPTQAEKDYPLGKLLNILVGICNALSYAHARGVVHRDLKPANIMLGDFGEVYVMDWGLAKVLGSTRPSPAPAQTPIGKVVTNREGDADLTQEGAILGTPVYMPPEQAAGRIDAIDQRSDVYSAGAILYEMLTTQAPIDREGGYLAILMRVGQGEIVRPELRNPGRTRAGKIPPELSAIAMKALATNPQDRYPTAEALRRDIERFQEGRSVSAKADSTREMIWKLVRRNKAASAATAAAAVLLVFCLLVVARAWWQSEEAARKIGDAYTALQDEQREKDRRTKEAVPAFLRSARNIAAEGAPDDALKQVDLALVYDPESADAMLLRGQLLIAQKDFAGGREALESYLRLRPDDADTRKAAGLAATGKTEDATVLFALAEYLQRQKLHGVAPPLLRDVARMAEARRPLVEVYRKQINAAWPGLGGLVNLQPNGQIEVNFKGRTEVTDLRALRGMQINVLSLFNGPKVSDLSPLEGMPLTYLDLTGNRVRDLTPVAGMKLTFLALENCPVSDLTPLRGMPLAHLKLGVTQVTDLTPLKGMSINYLNVGDTLVRDLEPLRDMPLTELHIPGTQVQNLSPLQGIKLTALDMYRTPVRDLTPLQGMPLVGLNIWHTGVTDLSPLKGMPLQTLWVTPKNITKGWDIVRGIKSLRFGVDFGIAYTAEEFWKKFDAGEFKK